MKSVFWVTFGFILYVYLGYPLVLWLASRFSQPGKKDLNWFPSVPLIIAAHNEEDVLQDKLENSLKIDYPRDRLEVIVVSDGTTENTSTIARSFSQEGILLHEIVPRGGKTRALNLAVNTVSSDILVLSDANTMYQPDALRKLVRHFADSTVGAVSGDVRLVNAADTHAFSETIYYHYERWLQGLGSRVCSMIGTDGGMYAISRKLFQRPSDTIILDDFVISMNVARAGYRVVYEPEAVALEKGTPTSLEEFRRKIRIVAGGLQAMKLGEGLPKLNQPLLIFGYLSHKLFRWLVPVFLILLFTVALVLSAERIYFLAFGGQVLFYGGAILYAKNALGLQNVKWMGISYYFSLVNYAALMGLWKELMGSETVLWQRTSR